MARRRKDAKTLRQAQDKQRCLGKKQKRQKKGQGSSKFGGNGYWVGEIAEREVCVTPRIGRTEEAAKGPGEEGVGFLA